MTFPLNFITISSVVAESVRKSADFGQSELTDFTEKCMMGTDSVFSFGL